MISSRLQAVLDWMECDLLADIGCDHGFLCIEALQQGKAKKALACDVNAGPLASAQKNIADAGLASHIETRRGNGFEALKKEDKPDTVVIAGMGASTMMDILDASDYSQRLFLVPHKDAGELRRYLADHDWAIVRERMVNDQHFYPVIEARKGKMSLSDEEQALGVRVEDDADYQHFLIKEKEKWQPRLSGLPADKRKEKEEYIQWINSRLLKK